MKVEEKFEPQILDGDDWVLVSDYLIKEIRRALHYTHEEALAICFVGVGAICADEEMYGEELGGFNIPGTAILVVAFKSTARPLEPDSLVKPGSQAWIVRSFKEMKKELVCSDPRMAVDLRKLTIKHSHVQELMGYTLANFS